VSITCMYTAQEPHTRACVLDTRLTGWQTDNTRKINRPHAGRRRRRGGEGEQGRRRVGAAVTHHQNHNSTVTESGAMVSMCSLSLLKQCKENSSTGRGQTHSLAPTIVSRLLVLASALSFFMQGPGEFISFAAFAKKSCFNHVSESDRVLYCVHTSPGDLCVSSVPV